MKHFSQTTIINVTCRSKNYIEHVVQLHSHFFGLPNVDISDFRM